MPDKTPNPSTNPATLPDFSQPIPAEAAEFGRKVRSLLDGCPKDEATVARQLEGFAGVFDMIAADMYSLASMVVGEGEDSMRLLEEAVMSADVTSCTEPEEARHNGRRALVDAALELIASRNPDGLAAPEGLEHAETCIEDDDLDAAGVSREELERMMAGPDRERVKTWLESLPIAMRCVFALRAVAGFSTTETVTLLVEHGGPRAAGWHGEAVRELFRQGLCSLASQMVKAGIRE